MAKYKLCHIYICKSFISIAVGINAIMFINKFTFANETFGNI